MRVSKKTLIVAAATALVALGATAVYAGPWFGGKKADRIKTVVQWKLGDALDTLDATDAQRGRITPLADALVDSALDRFSDHEAFREELLALWQAPKADPDAARARVFARIETARGLAHEAIDALATAHGVLSPEQRALVAEHVAERARDRQRTPEEQAERANRFAGFVVDEVADVADATKAQTAELKRLADTLVASGLSRSADREALREQALKLWSAPKADPAAAKAMLDARVDVWKALAGEAVDAAADAHGVLDAGQRDAVADAIRTRARRWH